ncbi:MAG TPA: ATP-dependent 6-phosphofructokinase [Polyangiaceae bacterium]|jgi:6-phosphofructokinase 1|nr:ATP-dependent 6-phosphofructokinase [Polyangiaceae bacterium]
MAIGLTEQERARRVVAADLEIDILGACRYPSPLAERLAQSTIHYVGQADRVLLDDRISQVLEQKAEPARAPAFELAGPRHQVFFQPSQLRCGIVTCGGLCPGLNNVIRGLVVELTHGYGVHQIYGFRYGYQGLVRRHGIGPVRLTPTVVSDAHQAGGTLLGTSRGNQDPREMVDRLQELDIGVLFVIGGDGTFRGAMSLVAEIQKRGLLIGVIGIPKTIDNDIHFIDRSFGFETAFSAAVDVIRSAHVEATGARNGIGVVKLMGRHSGFIACHAALASTDADLVLIPEIPIRLEGPGGLFEYLEARLEQESHALIVVAEGAGQELCVEAGDGARATDASGNVRLADIGVVLRDKIIAHFRRRRTEITLKYIDPSYHIRSVPASPADSVYCWHLARNAVHAALAGNTNMAIGRWHGHFVHVPLPLATRFRKQVNVEGDLWAAVVESTGQPSSFDRMPASADARSAPASERQSQAS